MNHLAFFHSFTLNLQTNFEFIWFNICLLILPISFLDGFMSLIVGWLVKFSFWSFRVIKELKVPFISVLSNILLVLRIWYLLCWFLFQCSYLLFYNLFWWHFSKGFDSCFYAIFTYWMFCLRDSALVLYLHATQFGNYSLLCETLIFLLF